MSILKYIKGRYLVIKGCRGSGRARAEALRAAEALTKPQGSVAILTKPQPRDYIVPVEVRLGPCAPGMPSARSCLWRPAWPTRSGTRSP